MTTPPARDSLGDRMKTYEAVTRQILPRRTFTVVRVDGRAFHSYLRGVTKPFDPRFTADMIHVATCLAEEASGCVLAYTQSDEISLVLADFANPATQPWFGGVVQKITSISAAIATAALNERRPGTGRPLFDARAFPIADRTEVMHYLRWRQNDCRRNSISMAGRAHMSTRQMHGMPSGVIVQTLLDDHSITWSDYPAANRTGTVVHRVPTEDSTTYFNRRAGADLTVNFVRQTWTPESAPALDDTPSGWLDWLLPTPDEAP